MESTSLSHAAPVDPRPARRGTSLSAALALGLAFGLAASAQAGTYLHQVLLDTDANAATGCSIAVDEAGYTGGPVAGVEYIVAMVVDNATTPARVTRIVRYECAGGVMSDATQVDPGGWDVGAGNGSGGADVVEGYVPRATLGNPSRVKIAFFSSAAGTGSDLLALAGTHDLNGGGPTAIPTLGEWGGLLLSLLLAAGTFAALRRRARPLLLAAIVLAAGVGGHRAAEAAIATILMDGNVTDWAGIVASGTDALGDSRSGDPAEDIVAGFVAWDASRLYFRVDIAEVGVGANWNQMIWDQGQWR